MILGFFGLVLHGHMPWCKKSGIWPSGEIWMTEAALETYIPMLNVLRELKEKGIKTALTINITPILAEMMADDYMKQRFSEYMEDLIGRAKNDLKRFENHPESQTLRPRGWLWRIRPDGRPRPNPTGIKGTRHPVLEPR